MIDARIQGIPCQIDVTHYHVTPAQGRWADSDIDCYGEVELEFRVYDCRGRLAPWLERKITDADVAAITDLVEKHARWQAEEARVDAYEY